MTLDEDCPEGFEVEPLSMTLGAEIAVGFLTKGGGRDAQVSRLRRGVGTTFMVLGRNESIGDEGPGSRAYLCIGGGAGDDIGRGL